MLRVEVRDRRPEILKGADDAVLRIGADGLPARRGEGGSRPAEQLARGVARCAHLRVAEVREPGDLAVERVGPWLRGRQLPDEVAGACLQLGLALGRDGD